MSQEWKVATIEQSKKLVELGVVLETEKYWVRNQLTEKEWWLDDRKMDIIGDSEWYPAPDVVELGVILPPCIEGEEVDFYGDEDRYYFLSFKSGDGWVAEFGDMWTSGKYRTEAQARCAALIWLIENKYLKPEERWADTQIVT